MAFEKYLIRENDGAPKMAIHLFRALLEQYLTGSKTAGETKVAIESFLSRNRSPITLSVNETSDLVSLTTYINNGADLFAKKNRMDEFYRVLICAESGIYWITREDLRTKLSWSEPD